MGLSWSTDCEQCGPEHRLVVRLICPSCRKLAASVRRTNCGLVWFSKQRVVMRGETEDAAIRWEFGTSGTPPRTGPTPEAAKLRGVPALHHIVDPREHDRKLADDPPGLGMIHRSPLRLRFVKCPGCGLTLRPNVSVVAEALNDYDRIGQPQKVTLLKYDT